MRLLFISNLYPPHHRGGYEMLCHEVATHLKARGHQLSVLCSTYGVTENRVEPGIYRRLKLESDLNYYRPHQVLGYEANRRANRRAFQNVIKAVEPDVVVLWGMWNLSRLIPAWAEQWAGSRVVYYLADQWPALPGVHEDYWDGTVANGPAGAAFLRLLRRPVRLALRREWRPFQLRYEHVITCSQSVRNGLLQAGLPLEQARVIYHGIDPWPYRQAAESQQQYRGNGQLRVVYVGSLLPQKGVHTAIEACGHLAASRPAVPVSLTILGAGHPQYEAQLQQLVQRWQLDEQITFHPPIPRTELPAFLAQFDVLVLPSTYEEPQARISQEAMAAGLVLVATMTGGTKEILVDGENGLAFEPEDAHGLAIQLIRLVQNYDLRCRLVQAGWQTVAKCFTIPRMIDEFESYLATVAEA